MKKITLIFCLIISGVFSYAQGLENIIVEKYYVADANDSIGNDAVAASPGALRVGAVTYRIYVDMLPGYKFLTAYGSSTHTLFMATTTTFFNNEDFGATTPTLSKAHDAKNTNMIDSWLTAGGTCAGNVGVLKTDDDGVATVVTDGLLKNNDASAGIPLTQQDGMIAGSPAAINIIGIPTPQLDVLGSLPGVGGTFTLTNGGWGVLGGTGGPNVDTNRVLITQLTTDGALSFELNIQVGDGAGGSVNYVANNPTGTEVEMASLTYPNLSTAVVEEKNTAHASASMSVYPNPATNKFVVRSSEFAGKNPVLNIYSPLGEKVYTTRTSFAKNQPESDVDITSLPAGLYFVELEANGVRLTKQLVKMAN